MGMKQCRESGIPFIFGLQVSRSWNKRNTTGLRTLWMRLVVGALGHGVTDAGVGVSGGGGGRSREQGGRGGGGGGGGGNCQRSAMWPHLAITT